MEDYQVRKKEFEVLSEQNILDLKKAMKIWAERHPYPDKPCLELANGSSYSPKQIFEEVEQETSFGILQLRVIDNAVKHGEKIKDILEEYRSVDKQVMEPQSPSEEFEAIFPLQTVLSISGLSSEEEYKLKLAYSELLDGKTAQALKSLGTLSGVNTAGVCSTIIQAGIEAIILGKIKNATLKLNKVMRFNDSQVIQILRHPGFSRLTSNLIELTDISKFFSEK